MGFPNMNIQGAYDLNANNQQEDYFSLLRRMSQMPEPNLPEPAGMQFDPKQMLIGSVLAGLVGGPEGANSFLQGTLQGKMAQQQQQNAKNQELYRRQKFEQDRQLGILKTEAEIANQKASQAFQQSRDYRGAVASQKKADVDAKESELDRKSRELIASMRGDTQTTIAAKKTLNDPKSTKAARAGALADLAQGGFTYPPEIQKEYLESTYYEENQKKEVAIKGQNANTAARNAATNEKRATIFGKESEARIKRMDVQSAQEVRRADAAITNANAHLKNVDSLIKDRSLNRDAANLRNANTSLGSTLSSLSTQINTLRQRVQQQTNNLKDMPNDDPMRKSTEEDIRLLGEAIRSAKKSYADASARRELLEKQLKGMNSGVNTRHQQALNAIANGADRNAVIKMYESKGEKWPGG